MNKKKILKKISENRKLAFLCGGSIAVILLGIYEAIALATMDLLGLLSMFLIWLPAFPIFIIEKIVPMNTMVVILLTIVMWFLIGGWIGILKFKKR